MKCAAVIATLLFVSSAASAQDAERPPLKPAALDRTARSVCTASRPTSTPSEQQRARARDLAQRGQQAAIMGDGSAALRDLRDAALIDPTDPDLAYQLARTYETAKDAANAAKEYCRFLALSPTAPEVGEVVEKVRILASPQTEPALDYALAAFATGLSAYDRGVMTSADSAFTHALAYDSTWADAYYNRAHVRLVRGLRVLARADFAQYLRYNPTASDRAAVEDRIATLSFRAYSPVRALVLGALIPGAGEFYTRRPIRGLLTLLAVGGAATYALLPKETPTPIQQTATDPFGNRYTYTATTMKIERPNLIYGAAAAGSIAGLAALDAAVYAFLTTREARRVAMSIVPGTNGLALRVAVTR